MRVRAVGLPLEADATRDVCPVSAMTGANCEIKLDHLKVAATPDGWSLV